MAGLDSIKKFDEGGATGEVVRIAAPKATGLTDKIALDPTQTENILANMQKYIDERQAPMSQFLGGLNKARAVLAGPTALTNYEREQNTQDKQVMDYRTQMAAYRAAQAQAGNEAARYNQMAPGAGGAQPTPGAAQPAPGGGVPTGGGNVPISQEQLNIENSLGTASEKLESRRKYLAGRNTEAAKKEFAPGMADVVDIFVPGQGMVQMTKAQAERLLNTNPNLQAIVDGNKVPASQAIAQPAAAPSAATVTAAPAAAPKPVTLGSAAKIASELGIPVTSGTRTNDEQWKLYDTWVAGGRKGPVVARPGTSKHETGNAIDVDMSKATPQQIEELRNRGFKQTVKSEPWHWELVSAPAEVARPSQSSTNQPAIPETRQQFEQRMKEQAQISESRIKEGETKRGEILQARESSIETGNALGRIESLLNTPEGNRAVGIFNKPGVVSAFGKILQEGIQAGNFGSVSFKGLEDAVRSAGGDQPTIDAAQKLARDFAQMQLNIAKRDLKGQGAVSDNERAIVAKVTGNTANSPEVLKDFTRWNRVRNTFDKQVGDALQDWEKSNPGQSYTKFKESKEYKKLENDYIAKTDAMAAKMNLTSSKASSSDTSSKVNEYLKIYGSKKGSK
jgi:hypothetical protein